MLAQYSNTKLLPRRAVLVELADVAGEQPRKQLRMTPSRPAEARLPGQGARVRRSAGGLPRPAVLAVAAVAGAAGAAALRAPLPPTPTTMTPSRTRALRIQWS